MASSAVLALFAVVWSVRAVTQGLKGNPLGLVDLSVYRAGGHAVVDRIDLYSMRAPGSGLPFTYPPFAAVSFVVLVPLGVGLGQMVFTAVSLLALGRACWLVGRAALPGRLPTYGLVAAACLLLVLGLQLEPTRESLRLGQVNLVLLWMVLEDLVGGVPERFRGVLIGLAVGLKLTPALFVIYLLVTGRPRPAMRAIGVFVATVLLGFVVVPGPSWGYWTHDAFDVSRVGGTAFAGNQALNGAIARLLGAGGGAALWLLAALAVGLAGLAVAWALSRSGRELMAVSTVALTGLVVSPVSWSHHWVWVLPLLGALAGEAVRPRVLRRWVPWAAVAVGTGLVWVFTSREIWGLPETNGREHGWRGLQLVQGNAYVLAALAFLVGAVWMTRSPLLVALRRTGPTRHQLNPARQAR